MAEDPVPRDGGNGPVDILRAATSIYLLAAVVACVSLGLVGGCGSDDVTATAADVAASDRDDTLRLIDAIGALLDRTSSRSDFEAARLRPDDVGLHPLARLESLDFMALVKSEAGERYAVQQRIDRFALRPRTAVGGDRNGSSSDDFRADAMARYAGTIAVDAWIDQRALIERVTLGLATFDSDAARVRDVDVKLVAVEGATSDCRLDYTVTDGLGLALRYRQSRCGTIGLTAGLATALSKTLDVDGELEVKGERVSVVGRGWLRRGWGEVPAPGGAIVFDRLVLELDGVGQVDALRSKRRSGRGPLQTTATVAGRSRGNTELQWLDDVVLSDIDGDYRWRLVDVAAGIDIEIVPVTALANESGVTGNSLRGGVDVSGTHTGVGFVDVVTIDAPDVRGALE